MLGRKRRDVFTAEKREGCLKVFGKRATFDRNNFFWSGIDVFSQFHSSFTCSFFPEKDKSTLLCYRATGNHVNN